MRQNPTFSGRRAAVGLAALALVACSSAAPAQEYDAQQNRYGARPTPSVAEADGRVERYGAREGSGDYATQAPAAVATPRLEPADPATLAPVGPTAAPTHASVSKGSGKLPNAQGQVWREYDIRPYTARSADAAKPQQALIDWILQETGADAWHSETLGLLHADRETLTAYHTPAMQGIVADVVDRFVNARSAERTFHMRILTVRNPDWRVRAIGLMTPLAVQSPGLQGWTVPRENYAIIASDLARRSDVREYNAANQAVPSGRVAVFSTMRPRSYTKGIVPTGAAWPGYQPELGTIQEGASLDFRPLASLDLREAEAAIKLRLHQVERMEKVTLDLPGPGGSSTGGQRLELEVPQLTMASLDERFRWPTDRVLVLSLGMVATPAPATGNPLTEIAPFLKSPPRADALLVIEVNDARPPAAGSPAASTAARPGQTFLGRY